MANEEMIKVTVVVSTGYACSEIRIPVEVSKEDWESMHPVDKQNFADSHVWDVAECWVEEDE